MSPRSPDGRRALAYLATSALTLACGEPYARMYTLDGTSIDLDGDSNLHRVKAGEAHVVGVHFGRQGGFETTREAIDGLSTRDATVVLVERRSKHVFVIVGVGVGETILDCQWEGETVRTIPIRAVP